MHRFYIFHPIQMFPFEVTAGAAFSLGSKSEDQAKNNTQILKALLNALERPESEDDFDKLLQEMFVTETFMAMTLGYDFLVKHPNKYIIEACNLLNITNGNHRFFPSLINFLIFISIKLNINWQLKNWQTTVFT